MPVGFVPGNTLPGIKPRVIKKLPRRARQDKTMKRVVGLRFPPAESGFAGRGIELVGPQQSIGKGEGVAPKFKASTAGFNGTCLDRYHQFACGGS